MRKRAVGLEVECVALLYIRVYVYFVGGQPESSLACDSS
jgi:hypothetical protein